MDLNIMAEIEKDKTKLSKRTWEKIKKRRKMASKSRKQNRRKK